MLRSDVRRKLSLYFSIVLKFQRTCNFQYIIIHTCFIVLKLKCMCSLGTIIVIVSVGSPGKEQFSVLPLSAGRLPVNVRVEFKQAVLLLSVTMRITPLTVTDGIVTAVSACTLILPLNKSLLHTRASQSLVQV